MKSINKSHLNKAVTDLQQILACVWLHWDLGRWSAATPCSGEVFVHYIGVLLLIHCDCFPSDAREHCRAIVGLLMATESYMTEAAASQPAVSLLMDAISSNGPLTIS